MFILSIKPENKTKQIYKNDKNENKTNILYNESIYNIVKMTILTKQF